MGGCESAVAGTRTAAACGTGRGPAAERNAVGVSGRAEPSVGRGERQGAGTCCPARQRAAMKRQFIKAACVLASCAPAALMACGVCIEDRVAATYDHAIIT